MEQALRKMPGQEKNADRLKAYYDRNIYLAEGGGSTTHRFGELASYKGSGKLLGYRLGDCWLNNMLFRYIFLPVCRVSRSY
jgi:hypothetical protein